MGGSTAVYQWSTTTSRNDYETRLESLYQLAVKAKNFQLALEIVERIRKSEIERKINE